MDCPLSEEVRQQISAAMYEKEERYVYWKSGARYYGTYGDYIVFFVPYTSVGWSIAPIGPYKFIFEPGGGLYTYRDGIIESLHSVYRNQRFTDEQLAQLYSVYESQGSRVFNTQTFGQDALQPYLKPLSKETVDRINTIGVEKMYQSWNWDGIKGYYGSYDDLVVMFWLGPMCVESGIQVADFYFTHSTSYEIFVFTEDDMLDLRQAYEKGLLSYEQICLIYSYHVLKINR
jgi:hypothetical protein